MTDFREFIANASSLSDALPDGRVDAVREAQGEAGSRLPSGLTHEDHRWVRHHLAIADEFASEAKALLHATTGW